MTALMSRQNRNKRIEIVRPSHPPPPPPIQLCQQARRDPLKGTVARAVESLQKAGFNPNPVLRNVNALYSKNKTVINTKQTMPKPSCSIPAPAPPPSIPDTPSNEFIYDCPILMPPTKPKLGPKPGDLAMLQKFFGQKTPLDVEAARRLACSSNRDGLTPLHQASRESRAQEVAALIRMGAPVNARENHGYQPVHKAAAAGSVQVLKLLKLAGADIQSEGNHGYRPIHRAALNGGMEAVRWLVEQGAPVDATITGGWTPLHLAVWWDREPVVRCLLALGATVNYMTDQGFTPLSLAVSGQHHDIARVLQNYGGVVGY